MKVKKKPTKKKSKVNKLTKSEKVIRVQKLYRLEARIQRMQNDINRYRDLGKHGEAIFSAIDNLIAARSDPAYNPKYPVSQFDVDYDPEGVFNRVKWYLLSKEQL